MGRTIKYYQEEEIEPWVTFDWATLKSLLWIGYDAHWTGGMKRAEECINDGVYGDVIAIFESFPHLIWNLMRDKKISVTDDKPFNPSSRPEKVHVNLHICLEAYSVHLNKSYSQRMEAWQQVGKCLEDNGFNGRENQDAICKAVYNALTGFISKAWNRGTNALVIAKAHSDMHYNIEDEGFAKRDSAHIPALEFSPQMWLVNFNSGDTKAARARKTQRGVRALFKLAAAEPPRQLSPQLEIPCYLYKGTTVKLQKEVEPGGMVSIQSSSWGWCTTQNGDQTNLSFLDGAGDCLLHISLRQGENAVVLNSKDAHGSWGQEERLQLRDTFSASNIDISVRHYEEGYEILFGYQPTTYYKKRIAGAISGVSYSVDGRYSPLSDALTVSTFDSLGQWAQTSYLANREDPGGNYVQSNTPPITTQPAFKRGANFTAAPGKKKKDSLGFEYAEHCYLGDAITLTLSDGTTVLGMDHTFTLENELAVTYGQINSLAGDFYGTYHPISDGSSETERATSFVDAYNTLAARNVGQPAEAIEILGILKKEVDAVNNALAHRKDPSVAYNSLPDETWAFQKLTLFRSKPSYLGLARIN